MKLKIKTMGIVLAALLTVSGLGLNGCLKKEAYANPTQKTILQVDKMPARASDYKLLDFKQKGLDVDAVLFDFAKKETTDPYNYETMGPIGYWDKSKVDQENGFLYFGFPSYIGSPQAGMNGAQEGITVLAALWAATAAGIDKSAQSVGGGKTYDFIRMTEAFLNKEPENFILNRIQTRTGQTFWYEVYPQIEFIRLHRLYPNETWMRDIIVAGAEKWHGALPNFKDLEGNVSFEFTSYDFQTNRPIYNGRWNEPPNGGLAMIFYYAYTLTGEEKYLDDARFVLDYLQNWEKSSYYEILQDYACYVAAVLNARHGANYDIQKFVNVSFEGQTDFRASTQVVNAKWGDYDAYGLMAFAYTDMSGAGYAFAMNTWHMAVTLANALRYDPRFADDIGKWFMHMANSSRIFFGNELPLANQSCPTAAPSDPGKAIAYEGVKSSQGDRGPYAMGDQLAMNWGGQTDYGIYGGAHVGLLGGLIAATDVPEILRVDLTKLDTLRQDGDYQQYLYYNPYGAEKTVTVSLPGPVQLYNTVTRAVAAESADGAYKLTLPAGSAAILALLPVGAAVETERGVVKAGGKQVAVVKPAVNILSPETPKTTLKSATEFKFSVSAPAGDPVKTMKITLGGKTIHEGAPVTSVTAAGVFGAVPKGTQNLVAEIETESGLKDIAMLRMRKL
ncbi:hypothetical protein FACS1894211_01700 [Clostridia bacterium]|nr:hypothetical protein FACS1894211_01700 [Clostridia bacterium]